ncbi:MAG: class I SAM-dependent methyltransferase [Candidatus Limnocylindrales bacterium]
MSTETIDRPTEPTPLSSAPEPTAGGEPVAPVPDDRRREIARAALRTLAKILPAETLALRLAGDDRGAPTMARAIVTVAGPDAVGRLLLRPTPDGFAEAYLRGDIDIEGEVMAAVDAGQAIDRRRLDVRDMRQLARWALALSRGAAPPPRLQRVARMRGQRHSRARDMAAIRFHYDVGEAFYGLWLDRRMAYSCAYFAAEEAPEATLDAAQEAKLDLICRKLDLRPGQRLLDIGCGWGSLILFAAERYGVTAVGVTLSQRQADEANRRATDGQLDGLAHAEVRDYRDLADLGTFDHVASVGMFEHVGRANLETYFGAALGALAPGGRFLNHGIATMAKGRTGPRSSFLDRYVFPDGEGELVTVGTALEVARLAGFELIDVQSLRAHYALTLTAWVRRLEAGWDEAVAAGGSEVARTWRLYMSAARLGFERGDLDVAQLLLARPATDGPAARPLRPWWASAAT